MPPPPGLAAALVSGEAEEERRRKVPRDTKVPSAGVELEAPGRGRKGRGSAGGGRAGGGAPGSLETQGPCAGGSAELEQEEEPARGGRVETKIGAASCWRVTPRSVGLEPRCRKVGNPKNPWRGWGEWGRGRGVKCRLGCSRFSQRFCARCFFLLPNSAG